MGRARAGLVGPMRATTPGEAFLAAVAPILDAAGPLPHARLDTDGESTTPKKQKTRILKCECATCGYTVRTARKWLEEAGAPLYLIKDHGRMDHEPLDGDDPAPEDRCLDVYHTDRQTMSERLTKERGMRAL